MCRVFVSVLVINFCFTYPHFFIITDSDKTTVKPSNLSNESVNPVNILPESISPVDLLPVTFEFIDQSLLNLEPSNINNVSNEVTNDTIRDGVRAEEILTSKNLSSTVELASTDITNIIVINADQPMDKSEQGLFYD